MEIKTIFSYILLLSIQICSYADNENVVDTISKFLILQRMPTKVTSLLCWNKAKTVYLTNSLNEIGVLHTNYIWNNKTEYIPKLYPIEHQLFIVDMKCNHSNDIINKANSEQLLSFPYRWILIDSENATNNFQHLDIYVNSRIYVIDIEISNLYKINSIYKVGKSRDLITNHIATWNDTKVLYYNAISDTRNRTNLMGVDMNISIVTIYKDTEQHLEDGRNRHKDAITKHNYVLMNHVCDTMNITRHIIMQPSWGTIIPNTTRYNGLLGDIENGITDLGGTPSFLTKDRILKFSFSVPPTPTRAKFVFRAPPLSVVANVFTLPFDIWVWYASFLLMAIIFLIIYMITQWEWRDDIFRKTIEDKNNVLRPTFLDIVQMEIGAVCQQGSEAEPKSLSGQIATFSIFLALMFMYTSYSANIVALLQSTTDSIKTLDNLLESKIKLGVEDVPYSLAFIQRLTGPVQKAIFNQKLNKPSDFMSLDVGVARLKNDFFAFHAEGDSIYKVISNTFLESEKCALKEIEYWTLPDPYIPMKKNTTYKELINVAYAKLLERGISNREFRRIYVKKPACQNQGANFMSVSISDSYFAFVVFSVGVSFAMFIFFIESMINKYYEKRTSNELVLLDPPSESILTRNNSDISDLYIYRENQQF